MPNAERVLHSPELPGAAFLFATRKVPIRAIAAQNGLIALGAGGTAFVGLLLARPSLPGLFGDTPLLLLLLAGLSIPFVLHTQFTAGLQNLQGQVTWQFPARDGDGDPARDGDGSLQPSVIRIGRASVLPLAKRRTRCRSYPSS